MFNKQNRQAARHTTPRIPKQRDTRHHGTAKQHDTHDTMVHLKSATQDNHGAPNQHDTRHHGSPKQRDTGHHGTAKQHDTRHHGSPKQRDTRYHRAAKHTAHNTMVHLNSGKQDATEQLSTQHTTPWFT
ncbi:hypothetical protein J6590_079252 [Homalodisca vitripennis]|nr:hypothetical protein J6590_079252 [Homalodisca vitripennis]